MCHCWCRGIVAEEHLSASQELSGCPLHLGQELAFTARDGLMWLMFTSEAGNWGHRYGYVFPTAVCFVGWQRKWGGGSSKISWSLPVTIQRNSGQSRQELLQYLEVVFWVSVLPVEVVELPPGDIFVRNKTLPSPGLFTGREEGRRIVKSRNIITAACTWQCWAELRGTAYAVCTRCVHCLLGCHSPLEGKHLGRLTQVLHCRAHPKIQNW